jgi:hypothetical protein
MYFDVVIIALLIGNLFHKIVKKKLGKKVDIIIIIIALLLIPLRIRVHENITQKNFKLGYYKIDNFYDYVSDVERKLSSTFIHQLPLLYPIWGSYYFATGYLRYNLNPDYKYTRYLGREKKICKQTGNCIGLHSIYVNANMKKEYLETYKSFLSNKMLKKCGFVSRFYDNTSSVLKNDKKNMLNEIGFGLKKIFLEEKCTTALIKYSLLLMHNKKTNELINTSIKACSILTPEDCFSYGLYFLQNYQNFNRDEYLNVIKKVCNSVNTKTKNINLFCSKHTARTTTF